MTARLLEVKGIQKRFGGVHALKGVDFDLAAGEVHVLLGENGAGKSTLMGILSGAYIPDAGEIHIDGSAVRFSRPREAHAAGIVMIPQELDLVPGLDIAANLFLGNEITKAGILASADMRRKAQDLLASAGVSLDASLPVASLRMGERQLVAIAKALSANARILIMDEPTAALSATEADHLFGVVKDLAARGVGIVYISHRLEEVPRIADRVTVMRDGAVVGTTTADAPQATLVQLLVGRPFSDLFPARASRVARRRPDPAARACVVRTRYRARRLASLTRYLADRPRGRDRRTRGPDGRGAHRTVLGAVWNRR